MKAVRGFLISQIGSILGSVVTDYVLSWYITIESGSGQLWAFAWGMALRAAAAGVQSPCAAFWLLYIGSQ